MDSKRVEGQKESGIKYQRNVYGSSLIYKWFRGILRHEFVSFNYMIRYKVKTQTQNTFMYELAKIFVYVPKRNY